MPVAAEDEEPTVTNKQTNKNTKTDIAASPYSEILMGTMSLIKSSEHHKDN